MILVMLQCGIFSACQQAEVQDIKTAAERTGQYLPVLEGKNCAVTANHSSAIGRVHLVDTLINAGIMIKKIFSPEHGYSGIIADGISISNTTDRKGIPVISLYGHKKKPSADDLKDIDIVIYDIQDVGVRFYTYISTLHYVMEACAENHIPLLILDRPNPNGFYVDGPVLDPAFQSFVGMHPIPVVYGLTPAELALMINGEGWLKNGLQCELHIVHCENYTHHSHYRLPINPSPNLRNMEAVYLYPSLAFFEGTVMNVGRGTPYPFQVFGSPDYPLKEFSYIPQASALNINPVHKGLLCYGKDLRGLSLETLGSMKHINLSWLIETYRLMNKTGFFTAYMNNLAGTDALQKQIEAGWDDVKIRESWKPGLEQYRKMREKYLLYPD
ncbi:MAG: DUF1343 domain-containing protein [Bacteroidales bacterium]|nr:DUF1343 domain-containing protein [Bacteroidales bacterium]MBN2761516.1 DUF1343 domain-containing protein [Bacteroidales bacterium]